MQFRLTSLGKMKCIYSENHGRAPLPLSSPSEPLYMAPGDPVFYTNSGAQENYAPLSEMTMLEGKALSLVLLIGPLSKVCVGVLSLKSPLLWCFSCLSCCLLFQQKEGSYLCIGIKSTRSNSTSSCCMPNRGYIPFVYIVSQARFMYVSLCLAWESSTTSLHHSNGSVNCFVCFTQTQCMPFGWRPPLLCLPPAPDRWQLLSLSSPSSLSRSSSCPPQCINHRYSSSHLLLFCFTVTKKQSVSTTCLCFSSSQNYPTELTKKNYPPCPPQLSSF